MKKNKLRRNRVFYIGFYSDIESANNETLYVSPAGIEKMNYVAKTIIANGSEVEIFSPSWSESRSFGYRRQRTITKGEKFRITQVPVVSSPLKITKYLCQLYSSLWLFWQLLIKANNDTNVILYHSVFFYIPILFAKKLKKFHLILEIEEIYHLFTNCSENKENALISLADSYIFSNILLHDYLKNEKDKRKPFCVVNGAYKVLLIPPKRERDLDLIKIVYAGVIDEQKRGAFNTVACAEKLSNRYKVFILGHGSNESVEKLKIKIERINRQAGYRKCEYLGLLSWSDYNDFLFDCDIAVSPQEPDETYVYFGFPSKILSYLSHNLRTVTTRLKCIETSDFSDVVVMVSDFSPINFAKVIMDLNLQESFNAIEKIKEADLKFSQEVKSVFHIIKKVD